MKGSSSWKVVSKLRYPFLKIHTILCLNLSSFIFLGTGFCHSFDSAWIALLHRISADFDSFYDNKQIPMLVFDNLNRLEHLIHWKAGFPVIY